ncbi:MAG: tRNA 2-thiouridine(34) synthase MnmA [Planctomycetota bacterium]|nr:MAG: tRNA 2-thiouridine(34) synthase MnmA [Planctomycetota bacterium]
MARILCALSGGVDSSVAALTLQEAGHELRGIFMRNGVGGAAEPGPEGQDACCSAAEAEDAARIAERLGIPFYAVDFGEEFGGIIDGFVGEYKAGRTPSPCVLCNQNLKFGQIFDFAEKLGCDLVATGHYARVQDGALFRGLDRGKDQSYFLFGIGRQQLARAVFPLGAMSKTEVRERARAAGFFVADKPESMELCFVPGGDYRELVRERAGLTPGRFVDAQGKELGRHDGYEGYTVGQRRGLPALGTPHYVLEIRPEQAEVVLGARAQLARSQARVAQLHWLIDAPRDGEVLEVELQIRARHRAAPAKLRVEGEGPGAVVHAVFDQAQDAIAPGQAAVFYDGDQVLGGGWLQY